jgi:hypothetical protein
MKLKQVCNKKKVIFAFVLFVKNYILIPIARKNCMPDLIFSFIDVFIIYSFVINVRDVEFYKKKIYICFINLFFLVLLMSLSFIVLLFLIQMLNFF